MIEETQTVNDNNTVRMTMLIMVVL